jgi:hypothetical protein
MKTTKGPPKAVILDDEKAVETAIRRRLPKDIAKQALTVEPPDIAKLVTELGRRIGAARKGSATRRLSSTDVDDADLFIVDYDLIGAQGEDYLTGETVAYLARCYSACGVIVGLNQFHRRPTFDLTLRAQLDSFADLNLSADDLSNPGLWVEGPWKGYRPWAWPILTGLVQLMRLRVQDIKRVDLHTPVADFLHFPQSAIERFPTSSFEILGGPSGAPEKATLKDILRSPTMGLRGKEAEERKASTPQDAHIIAARLSAWLNMILTPQDVLVDAPHLADRCPSVLGPKVTPARLAGTTRLRSNAVLFKSKQLKKAEFTKHFWYDRPVWFWTEIERQRLLPEITDPWRSTSTDYAFCEDTSSFAKRSTCRSFQSDLLSPYRVRYIKKLPNIDYQPIHRLALA